jgi:predicted permease
MSNSWQTLVDLPLSGIQHAVRRLRLEWRFTLAFVITLALGIAANATVFSALDAYVLHPLPYPHSGRLLDVYFTLHKGGAADGFTSVPAYEQFRRLPAITDAGLFRGYGTLATVITGSTSAETLRVAHVTASAFQTLDVRPLLGRWFTNGADRPQGPREAVLSYGLWNSDFGGTRHVLGRSLRVNGKLFTIIGVMPRDFAFPARDTALWLPFVVPRADFNPDRLTNWNAVMIARPRPGVSRATLQTQLNLAVSRLEEKVDATLRVLLLGNGGVFAGAMTWQRFVAGSAVRHLVIMQLGAGILLLLAVASLVNLAIVRALRRRQALAIHVVLGAWRTQLLLTALFEALPIAALATLLAWPLGRLGSQALTWFGVASERTAFHLVQGTSLWLIAFAVALLLSILVLATPQTLMRFGQPGQFLQGGIRETDGGRTTRYLRQGLSVTQIALAVLLLASASLLGLSVRQMLRPQRGLRSDHLAVASLLLHGAAYRRPEGYSAVEDELGSATEKIPGVTAVGIGEGAPFASTSGTAFRRPSKHRWHMASITLAGPGFLRTLGVRLLRGRLIRDADISSNAPVVVVDRRYAHAVFGTSNVIGRIIDSNGVHWRIIGVVETIPDQFAAFYASTQGTVFLPEAPVALDIWAGDTETTILIRSRRPAFQLRHEFLVVMHRLLPDQSLFEFSSMNRLIAASAKGASAVASLVIASGLLAFVLAVVGTYGVVAYVAGIRRQEFAIRQALGATAQQIQGIIMNQGFRLWGLGVALGVCTTIVLAPFLQAQLYQVSVHNAGAYLAPPIALGCVVAVASWLAVRQQWKVGLNELLQPD